MIQVIDSKYSENTRAMARLIHFIVPYARTAHFLQTKEEQIVLVNLGWDEISENQLSWLKVFIDDNLYRIKKSMKEDGNSIRLKKIHIRLHGGTFEVAKDLKSAAVVKKGGLLLKITFPFAYIGDFRNYPSYLTRNVSFEEKDTCLLTENLMSEGRIQNLPLYHERCKRKRIGNKYTYTSRIVDWKEVTF